MAVTLLESEVYKGLLHSLDQFDQTATTEVNQLQHAIHELQKRRAALQPELSRLREARLAGQVHNAQRGVKRRMADIQEQRARARAIIESVAGGVGRSHLFLPSRDVPCQRDPVQAGGRNLEGTAIRQGTSIGLLPAKLSLDNRPRRDRYRQVQTQASQDMDPNLDEDNCHTSPVHKSGTPEESCTPTGRHSQIAQPNVHEGVVGWADPFLGDEVSMEHRLERQDRCKESSKQGRVASDDQGLGMCITPRSDLDARAQRRRPISPKSVPWTGTQVNESTPAQPKQKKGKSSRPTKKGDHLNDWSVFLSYPSSQDKSSSF